MVEQQRPEAAIEERRSALHAFLAEASRRDAILIGHAAHGSSELTQVVNALPEGADAAAQKAAVKTALREILETDTTITPEQVAVAVDSLNQAMDEFFAQEQAPLSPQEIKQKRVAVIGQVLADHRTEGVRLLETPAGGQGDARFDSVVNKFQQILGEPISREDEAEVRRYLTAAFNEVAGTDSRNEDVKKNWIEAVLNDYFTKAKEQGLYTTPAAPETEAPAERQPGRLRRFLDGVKKFFTEGRGKSVGALLSRVKRALSGSGAQSSQEGVRYGRNPGEAGEWQASRMVGDRGERTRVDLSNYADNPQMQAVAEMYADNTMMGAAELTEITDTTLNGFMNNFEQTEPGQYGDTVLHQIVALAAYGKISPEQFAPFKDKLQALGWDVQTLATINESQFAKASNQGLLGGLRNRVNQRGAERRQKNAELEKKRKRLEALKATFDTSAFQGTPESRQAFIQELDNSNEVSGYLQYLVDQGDESRNQAVRNAVSVLVHEPTLNQDYRTALESFLQAQAGNAQVEVAGQPVALLEAIREYRILSAENLSEQGTGLWTRLKEVFSSPIESIKKARERALENQGEEIADKRETIIEAVTDEQMQLLIREFASGRELSTTQQTWLDAMEAKFNGEGGNPTVNEVITLLMTDRIGYSWKVRSIWREHKQEIQTMHKNLKVKDLIDYKKENWNHKVHSSGKFGAIANHVAFRFFQGMIPIKISVDKYGRPNLNGVTSAENATFGRQVLDNISLHKGLQVGMEGKGFAKAIGYVGGICTLPLLSAALIPAKVGLAAGGWGLKLGKRVTGIENNEQLIDYLEQKGKMGSASAKVVDWASRMPNAVAARWVARTKGTRFEGTASDFGQGVAEAARIALFARVMDTVFDATNSWSGMGDRVDRMTEANDDRINNLRDRFGGAQDAPAPMDDSMDSGIRSYIAQGEAAEARQIDSATRSYIAQGEAALEEAAETPEKPTLGPRPTTSIGIDEAGNTGQTGVDIGELLEKTTDNTYPLEKVPENAGNPWQYYRDVLVPNAAGEITHDEPVARALTIMQEVLHPDQAMTVGQPWVHINSAALKGLAPALDELYDLSTEQAQGLTGVARDLWEMGRVGADSAAATNLTAEQVNRVLELAKQGRLDNLIGPQIQSVTQVAGTR